MKIKILLLNGRDGSGLYNNLVVGKHNDQIITFGDETRPSYRATKTFILINLNVSSNIKHCKTERIGYQAIPLIIGYIVVYMW
jgi:hypothetical protein